ncbi:probable farnesyl diphosphate synthase DDB_G0278823 [Battus philenor]|uniref:probable farnesyl diphosphate synthase DDB_G0278823 n=1 Tax=Battus philenor TaxID=42288 RepID=UPI0035D04EB0
MSGREIHFKSEIGRHLQFTPTPPNDFIKYNIKYYENIARLRTSQYSLTSPIQLFLVLNSKESEDYFDNVNYMCNDLGVLLQINKIFGECYGSSDPKNIKHLKELYDDMHFLKLYKEEETSRFETCSKKVHDLPVHSVPSPEFFPIGAHHKEKAYAKDRHDDSRCPHPARLHKRCALDVTYNYC